MLKTHFSFKSLLLTILLGLPCFYFQLIGQVGFNKIYELPNSSGLGFFNIQSKDNNVVLYGNSLNASTQKWEIVLCKIDTSGEIVDSQSFADSIGSNLVLMPNSDFIFTSDGGYAMVGIIQDRNSGFLMKLDSAFRVEFIKEFTDLTARVYFLTTLVESSSGYFIGGYKQEIDFSINIFLISLNSNGEKIWQKTYGSPDSLDLMGSLIKIEPDRYAVGASISSPIGTALDKSYGKSHVFIIDGSGNIISEWKSSRNEETGVTGLHFNKTDSTWIYITRTFEVVDPNDPSGWVSRGRLIKRDKNFNFIWDKDIGEPNSYLNYLSDLILDNSDKLVIVGELLVAKESQGLNSLDGLIYKFSENGDSLWRSNLAPVVDSSLRNENYLTAVTVLPSGSIISCGYTNIWESPARSIGWIVKLNANGCLEYFCNIVDVNDNLKYDNSILFPNPAVENISIKYPGQFNIDILSLSGQLLLNKNNLYDLSLIDISNLTSGSYYIRIKVGNKFIVKRFIKV